MSERNVEPVARDEIEKQPEERGGSGRSLPPGWKVQRLMLYGLVAFLLVAVGFPLAIWWVSTRQPDPRRSPVRAPVTPVAVADPAVERDIPPITPVVPMVMEEAVLKPRRPEWVASDSPEAVFERLWPLHATGEATAEEEDALIFLAQELRYFPRARQVLEARMSRDDPAPTRETRVLAARQEILEGKEAAAAEMLRQMLRQDPAAWSDNNVKWLAGVLTEKWVSRSDWQAVIDLLGPVRVPLPPVFHRQLAQAYGATERRQEVAELIRREAGSFLPLERIRARLVLAALAGDSAGATAAVQAGLEHLSQGAQMEDWAGFFESVGTIPSELPRVLEAARQVPGWGGDERQLMSLVARAGRVGTWEASRQVAGMLEVMWPENAGLRHNRLYLDLIGNKVSGAAAVAEARALAVGQTQSAYHATVLMALLRANRTEELDAAIVALRETGGAEAVGPRWILAWGEAARGRPVEAKALLDDFDVRGLLPEERVLYDRLRRNLGLDG